ncbi:MAG: serine/threonine-protein kinase [Verrucomicrobiales bacterium]|nr:serine/threonine-protein kinase [Verrucomicrobiales bacterium]
MSKRYEIREQIGKGGLGAVYKAFDTQLQREVAIKRVLSPDQASDEEVKEAADKLIAEAQTLSTLNHPNIITVFDVGQDEKGGFVVMELLKGETLDETIARGVLTQEDFTEIVYQTIEALIAAQASDVIHRDIKPTNIMVIWQASGKFQTKILDFGLAKFSKSPSVQTMDQEDSVLGSIFFMAPEQFERGELDARTDLYQMGCVYYNALTGQYPFNGDTAPQVMNAHLQHKVIPLEQIRPDLPPAICQWVMWLINRDMEHRPADAREALKKWPRDPQPAGIPVATALPVEDTPKVASDAIKIVTAEGQASAPPALIVTGETGNAPMATPATQVGATTGKLITGATTGRLQTGATTGRLQTGPARARGTAPAKKGAVGGSRPNVRKTPAKKSSHKGKWIVLAGIAALIVVLVVVKSMRSAAAEKRNARIVELASDDGPEITLADVALAVDFLANPETTPSLRSDAMEVLDRAEGANVNDLLHTRLKETENTVLQMRLANILSEKGHSPAVPTILAAFQGAPGDKEKVQLLSSVRAIADMDQIGQIVDALQGDHSQAVRNVFEDTVLAVLRKSSSSETVVDDLLTRVSTTSGSERKSLFRILGALGGSKVETRMASIYSKRNDPEYQRDAMVAYLNWKDRSAIPEVEKIIETTEDQLLRTAAVKALLRLSSLPGDVTEAERIALWKKVFELNENPNDARRLIALTIEYPSPATVKLLEEWSSHEKFGNLAKGTVKTLQQALANVPEIAPGEELKGNKARVQGDNRAAINSFVESLTSWISPDTWFSWTFKVKEPGNYSISVDQATLREDPSEFHIYLGGQKFSGQSATTETLEEFTTVKPGGTIALEKGKIYTLVLAAGERVQPRMMDIHFVTLVKAGGGGGSGEE